MIRSDQGLSTRRQGRKQERTRPVTKLRPLHMGVIFRVLTNVIKNIRTFLLNQWETRHSYMPQVRSDLKVEYYWHLHAQG